MSEGLSESSSTSVLCVCMRACLCARACVYVHLHLYFVCASREGSGETARLRRLSCAFIARHCSTLLDNVIRTKIACPVLISYYMLQVYDKPVTLPHVLIE